VSESARDPNDLERLFVERANAGDVDGLVALYEPSAVLVPARGKRIAGTKQLRSFFAGFLKNRPRLARSIQAPAVHCGELALTSSRHSNGDVSVEIARRQPDGRWLWVVDRFSILDQA
jgi:ketosteroid isomerase-like protein